MSTVATSLRTAPHHRAALWLVVFAATIFTVAFEQGTVTAGQPLFHELFHDARHLLGFPCH